MAYEYSDYLNQVKKVAESSRKAAEAESDKAYDEEKKRVSDEYGAVIEKTEASYEDEFKKNDLQRILDERYLERRAAEMGLENSGMNRTGQTALAMSYANRKGELERTRREAVDALAEELRLKTEDIESEKKTAARKIESNYENLAQESAEKLYNAELSAEDEREEREQKALSAAGSLIPKLSAANITDRQKRAYIESYISQYGGGVGLKQVYEISGISADDAWNDVVRVIANSGYSDEYKQARFEAYVKTFNVPSKKKLDTVGYIPGCEKWSYKKLTDIARGIYG